MAGASTFTQETADAICERIADGESLRDICKADDMPARSTVFKWLDENRPFSDQYARAREAQADGLFEEILSIADDGTNDFRTTLGSDGEVKLAVDHDHIARSRLRVDARKWMASKLAPKRYGEKIEVAGDPAAPVAVTVIERRIVRPSSRDAG